MLASCWEQANNRVAETSIRALVALLNQFSCIDRRNYRVSSHGVVSPRRAFAKLRSLQRSASFWLRGDELFGMFQMPMGRLEANIHIATPEPVSEHPQ